MTAILEDVKPPVEDIALPEIVTLELNEVAAGRLLDNMRSRWAKSNELSAKRHVQQAEFRRDALKLSEGKGYRHFLNEDTGEPYTNIKELGVSAFNIRPVQMHEYTRAAKTEREMYGKTAEFRTKEEDYERVDSFTYSQKDTPTVYVLEILRKNLPDAQARVRVFFFAKQHCHDMKAGYTGKSYPSGKDILRAAGELGYTPEYEISKENTDKFRTDEEDAPTDNGMPTLEQRISTLDAEALQHLEALIADRKAVLSTPPPAPRKTKQVTVQEDTPLPVGARVQLGAYRCLIKRIDAALDEVSYCIEGEASGQVYTVPRHTLHGHPATLPA